MILLLTGGSGFLGSHLVPRLSPFFDKIYLLYRSNSRGHYEKLYSKLTNVEFVDGDLVHPDLFEDLEIKARVESEVTHVLHAAALYDLAASKTQNYFANVIGTQNILNFLKRAKNLQHFAYISTIAVSGDFEGKLAESELDVAQSFKNSYAETKYLAEKIVRTSDVNSPWKTTIYRLGILLGDHKSGEIQKIDGPYYLLKYLESNPVLTLAMKSWAILPFPLDKNSRVPLIPVDLAAAFIEQSFINPVSKELSCYHVVSNEIPTTTELLKDLLDLYGIHARIIGLPKTRLYKHALARLELPASLIDYFYLRSQFDQQGLAHDYPEVNLGCYRDYKGIVLNRRVLKKVISSGGRK